MSKTIEAMKRAHAVLQSGALLCEVTAASILCEAIAAEEAQGVASVGVVDEGDDGLFVDLETENGIMVKRGDRLFTRPAPPQSPPVSIELLTGKLELMTAERDKFLLELGDLRALRALPPSEKTVLSCRNCAGFGWEPTVYSGRIPCSHCSTAPPVVNQSEAVVNEKAQGVGPVYLVATGIVHEGHETYTRHDVCPPLCDAEKLFTSPIPPADHIGEATKFVGERGALVKELRSACVDGTLHATLVNKAADMLDADTLVDAKAWHRGRDAGIAEVARVNAQQVAVPQGWKLVPVKLTQDMRSAWDSAPTSDDDNENMHAGYSAMLAAAPTPPQAERVPMTPEQISDTYQKATGQTLRPCDKHVVETLTREIEAHHKIGVKQ